MLIATYIYKDFYGTDWFLKSLKKFNHEPTIVRINNWHHPIVMKELYNLYKKSEEEYMIYMDAADSFIQGNIEIPKDKIIYQTEKACFPFPNWADKFENTSRWRFLNGGGYCGPTKLVVEFFEKYNLMDIGTKNAQAIQQEAFLDAKEKGFPIELDVNCNIFQSIAFSEEDEFSIIDKKVFNNLTNTFPIVLHGNGRTPMDWVYNLL